MNIRQILSAIVVAAMPLAAAADTEAPDSIGGDIIARINASGCITIVAPSTLASRLIVEESAQEPSKAEGADEASQAMQHKQTRVGYRVLVFDDNNVRTAKHEAQSRKAMVERRFPDYKGYITYNSPYWRVKVGDFRTRSEAEAAMASIRQAYPSFGANLRVVRDHINPR